MEEETAAWFKMDPDPFDDRHPGSSFSISADYNKTYFHANFVLLFIVGRADPNCALGHLLKAVFKNEALMNKVNESHPLPVI